MKHSIDRTIRSRLHFAVFMFVFLFTGCFTTIPYIEKTYETRIGQKLVAAKDVHLIEYEIGKKLDDGDRKTKAIRRRIYFMGVRESAAEFMWQKYDISPTAITRSLEKEFFRYPLTDIPCDVTIKGFVFTIHDANEHYVTYTLQSASPLDLDASSDEE